MNFGKVLAFILTFSLQSYVKNQPRKFNHRGTFQ